MDVDRVRRFPHHRDRQIVVVDDFDRVAVTQRRREVRRADRVPQLALDVYPAEADLFLTPSDGEPLVHRPRSDHDGATPHSTGVAVLGLLRFARRKR